MLEHNGVNCENKLNKKQKEAYYEKLKQYWEQEANKIGMTFREVKISKRGDK